MTAILTQLAEARQKARRLQTELDEYAERQYRGVKHIVNQPGYKRLQAELLRAKGVVRSLERKASQR
jgi:hypothetical protein